MGSFVSFLRRNLFSIIVAVVTSLIISAELYIESAVYWTRAGISFAILLPLFVLISEKRLLQQTKNLLSEKKGWSRILEVLILPGMTCTVFVALLLIAQEIGLLPVNPFLICLGLFISVSAALAIRHLPFPGYCRIILMVLFYTVMILYFYYNHIRSGYIGWTLQGIDLFSPISLRLHPWLQFIGLILLAAQFRLSPLQALITLLVNIPLFFVTLNSHSPLISDFFTLIMLSNLAATPRVTAKVILGSLISILGFISIGFSAGWVEDKPVTFAYAGIGHSLGMGHPNLTALMLLSLLLLTWYLWLKDHPVITTIISLPAAICIYFITYSRTGAICLLLIPLFGIFWRFMLQRKYNKAFVLPALSTIAATLFSLGAFLFVPKEPVAMGHTFILRFTYPYTVLREQGFSLFGLSNIDWTSIVIDNLFYHVLVCFGIVSLVIVLFILFWFTWKYYQQKQYSELIILAILMIYSIMENALLYMPYGFILLLLATKEQWYPRHNNKHLQALQPSP